MRRPQESAPHNITKEEFPFSFQFSSDQAVITVGNADHTSRQISCGLRGEWKESRDGFF